MFVRTLEIQGFMPYRDKFRLSFHEGQIIGITGQYGDDTAKSNRSGKSSFVDAQVWCLYGESRAKKDIEIIHNDADFAQVSAELFEPLTGKSVWVTRSRDNDNKGVLEITGTEGEKKKISQEAINKMIGMNYEEFSFTAFFKQNDIDQFMEADSSKKKEIMMKWLQQVNWEDPRERVNEFKLELTGQKNKIETLLQAANSSDVVPGDLLIEAAQLNTERKALSKEQEVVAKKVVEISMIVRDLKGIDAKKEKVVEIADKIQGLKNRRPDTVQAKEALAKLKELLEKYEIVDPEKLKEAMDKRDAINSAIGQANSEIKDFKKQIDLAGKDMNGICPILKQACSRIESDPDHVKSLKSAIEGTEKKVARYHETLMKLDKLVTLHSKQSEWRQKREKIEYQMKAAAQLESQIADLSNQKAAMIKEIPPDAETQLSKNQHAMAQLKDRSDEITDGMRTKDKRLGQIQEILKQHKETSERKESYEVQLKALDQQLADAQYVEYMFGKNGIPSMELENSYHEIEEDANMILSKLRAPFHLEFEATRRLNDWEPNCLACGEPFAKGEKTHRCKECGTEREKKRKDELSLKVFEGGVERQFYMDSGGGKILLSVAMRLALTMLARRRKGTNWGTIYLDEVFGQLDATNRRMMADLITTVLREQLGFEQIFIISHDPNIQSSMADQLIVRRNPDKGYSELYM